MAHHFLSGEASLWIQRNGPNTQPVFLGCHALGDVDQPEGDLELIYCPDESGPNRFKVVASVQGAAGAITTSITTDITDDIDELERAKCPFTLFAHLSKNGRKDLFTNFDRTYVFSNTRITSRGIAALVARTPDDNSRAEQSFDLSAESLLRLKEPEIARQSGLAEVNAINDISFCNAEQCRTDEEVAQTSCQIGFAVADPTAAATANVLYTSNGGSWTATATDPFVASAIAVAVECFDFGRDVTRVIVASGTTAVGAAKIAYSDDNGTTWTVVDVGVVAAAFFATARSLFALDRNNIWAALTNGYIYHSPDGGLSWALQEAGNISTTAWNSIRFVDAFVGWAGGVGNELARTVDGGTTWSAITGPAGKAAVAINVVEVLDRNRVWLGYADGSLWYTNDAGLTWFPRAFSGSGVGQVRDIRFFNDSLGYMITNNAAPIGRAHWTIDGGYTWQVLGVNTNAGYNALFVCDEWGFFIAGEAESVLGYIAKGSV